MAAPDQRLFEADLQLAEYRAGVVKGLWAQAEPGALPDGDRAAWPNAYFWMVAAPRSGAPDRYYVALNLQGYNAVPPTGPFWDPVKKQPLEIAKWPKGKPGSRFALVFRTSGFGGQGRAFYHPYDRTPLQDHGHWRNEQPHLVWTETHTIVDYLEEFQSLLTGADYAGV
jgi:hypothetical protein